MECRHISPRAKDNKFGSLYLSDRIYAPDEVGELLDALPPVSLSRKKGVAWYNYPCAFDIETTSFYDRGEKRACMYVWQFCIDGLVMIGRTWEEWETVMQALTDELQLSLEQRLRVYVHNLSFEFGFMGYGWEWEKVFAVDALKPVYAVLPCGIEFYCSYLLSGYSLSKLGDELLKYPVRKLDGDLDYSLLRHSGTPLTEKEIGYCVNDVKVVSAYIQERIEEEHGIARIPLTKTGYVRRYCRRLCLGKGSRPQYQRIMERLTLSVDEYTQLRRAFAGGFTHADPFAVGNVFEDVTSIDFTSSYPYVMLSEQFPMNKAEYLKRVNRRTFYYSLKYYCCVFDVELVGLRPKIIQESYLSLSKCRNVKGAEIDNGRIVRADKLETTITNVDWEILEQAYTWDKFRVYNFRRYQKGYLPTSFVKAILKLYVDKTALKGVEGKELEYMLAKAMLNACFGMAVTAISRPEYIFPDNWNDPKLPDLQADLIDYNNDRNRFLFYPWGVFVTAYARRNLWTGILAFGRDYLYSDTDSIKATNFEKHREYVEQYNADCRRKLEQAMEYHGIPIEETEPQTIKGVKKPLGVWDIEETYSRFKTMGAKRYMVQHRDGSIDITVAGLNKKTAVPYLLKKGKTPEGAFKLFDFSLDVPPEFTGKNTHTYLDEIQGVLTDYTGQTGEYHEYSGVHLENAPYTMNASEDFLAFLFTIRTDAI